MNIGLLVDPSDVCYGSLNSFLFEIETSLHKFLVHTERIVEINDDIVSKHYDAFIGLNRSEPAFVAEDGSYFMDSYFGCPFFNILVDAPYSHYPSLHAHMENLYVILLDNGYVEYCKKNYPDCKSVEMGYLLGHTGGQNGNLIPYEKRGIDILFTGTYRESDYFRRTFLASQCSDEEKNAFLYMIENGIKCPHKTIESLFRDYLMLNMAEIDTAEFVRIMSNVGVYADIYLRSYWREKVIDSLADSGMNITLAGSCWEEYFQKTPKNVTLLGEMNMESTGNLTANAKILLNVMPWFKDGLHDRIPTAMHNGAVCVTDSSSYIDMHFQDGENIVLYQLDNLGELPDKCQYLLEHPKEAASIARAGKEKAGREYTWERFVLDYILKWLI